MNKWRTKVLTYLGHDFERPLYVHILLEYHKPVLYIWQKIIFTRLGYWRLIFFSIIERVIPRESLVLESKAALGKVQPTHKESTS